MYILQKKYFNYNMLVDTSIILLVIIYFLKTFVLADSLEGTLQQDVRLAEKTMALEIYPAAETKTESLKPHTGLKAKKARQKFNVVSFRQKKTILKTGLFGSKEIKNTRLTAFRKWNNLLQRHQKDIKKIKYKEPNLYGVKSAYSRSGSVKMICGNSRQIPCDKEKWISILTEAQNLSKLDQLKKINRHLNKVDYITDIDNWGLNDYWATLKQFFRKDGDCEDYAIAKYFSLKKLGFHPNNMRIAVVQDMNLNVPHAVLIVYLEGKTFVLDNQISSVAQASAILHYKPLYSINENAWWMHHT